jgi:hypothetical protein
MAASWNVGGVAKIYASPGAVAMPESPFATDPGRRVHAGWLW